MNRLEKLIAEIRKQLLPYRHEHDIERGCERWDVEKGDCLTAWVAGQLIACGTKNGCAEKKLCAFYSYSDIARKNYQICREVTLMLESGDAHCSFIENDNENGTAK
jgi:hypothetical protein